MKSFFITGSTGYVGSNLAIKLANEGHQINAFYRDISKTKVINHQNIHLFKGSLDDKESLLDAMKNCDGIFHTAAYVRPWAKNSSTYYNINVQGTQNIISAAKKSGIRKVVFTSTAGIYGPSDDKIIDENTKSRIPFISEYEKSKYQALQLILESKSSDFFPVIVCPTRIYGPGIMAQSNSVTQLIHNYILGKWHVIPGNGKAIGNYVFVNDVINGHILAFNKGESGQTYLLGGTNLSYNEFFKTIKKLSRTNHKLFHIPIPYLLIASAIMQITAIITGKPPLITTPYVRKFSYNWEVSIRKAVSQLGYQPTEFDIALNETLQWLNDIF